MTTGGRRFRASGHTLQRSSSPAIAPCAIGAMCDEATGLERRSHLLRNDTAGAEWRAAGEPTTVRAAATREPSRLMLSCLLVSALPRPPTSLSPFAHSRSPEFGFRAAQQHAGAWRAPER